MQPTHRKCLPQGTLLGCVLLAIGGSFLLPAQQPPAQQPPAQQPPAQQPPAQQPGNSEPTTDRALLQALLTEMRQLRMTLERSSALVPRLQLAIARYQMQQERVDRLERELRNFRAQLATDLSGRDRMTAALKQIEEQATQSQDPTLRKQMDEAARVTKSELEQQAVREQQGRVQEIEMANQLRAEEAKLNDLTEQINQLDRKMQQ